MTQSDNRDLLIRTASRLFRQKGYDGVGLKEILDAANLPKGSLYYHFPEGKRALADAATRWAGDWLERLLSRCFEDAPSFEAGSLAACESLLKAVACDDTVPACPVLSILQAAPSEPALRQTAKDVYGGWTRCLARHAARLGHPEPEAAAFSLHIRLQGAWVLAYAQQSGSPFRHLADELRRAIHAA
ncbi:TetR/AcrR family transcriptional regulator [Cereibacter sphaeroides]|nr:TetR/AcrR family transcriptional regulator [Cereibacter sphaeroides]